MPSPFRIFETALFSFVTFDNPLFSNLNTLVFMLLYFSRQIIEKIFPNEKAKVDNLHIARHRKDKI